MIEQPSPTLPRTQHGLSFLMRLQSGEPEYDPKWTWESRIVAIEAEAAALAESATGPLPPTDDPEGQAMAFRTFGEQIAEIGLREIAEDRSLNADEVQAVVYLARALLQWCSATGPLHVELLARAFVAMGLDLDGLTPAEGREAVERLAAEYARLASQVSGASDE